MDVLFFLKERTTFIRYYYDNVAGTFQETMRRIEEGEPPWDNPPWDESGEPPFLDEYTDAANGLNVAGRSCVALLSRTISTFFKAWERELCIRREEGDEKLFKKGILDGYRRIFEHFTKVAWADGPADISILEQVIFTRNTDQHGGDIMSDRVYHEPAARKKFPKLLFVSGAERPVADTPATEGLFSLIGEVEVTRDSLFRAIGELEELATWLDPQLEALWREHR